MEKKLVEREETIVADAYGLGDEGHEAIYPESGSPIEAEKTADQVDWPEL